MAFSQSDLDALDRAIALGAEEVRYADGRLTRFRSFQDMLALRATMAAGVAGKTPTLADLRVATGYISDLSRGAPGFGCREW